MDCLLQAVRSRRRSHACLEPSSEERPVRGFSRLWKQADVPLLQVIGKDL